MRTSRATCCLPSQRANPLPGTLDLQLNGKQRSSIIEYIQREDELAADDTTVGSKRDGGDNGQDSDDEDDEGEASGGVRVMDPFYRELERAEEERNKKKEDERDAMEEKEKQREEVATPHTNKQPADEEKDRKRSSLLSSSSTTTPSRRNSAISTPSTASLFSPHHSTNTATTPSRRMSRPTDSLPAPSGGSLHNSRAPSRSSLSAGGSTRQKPRMLAGRGGQTAAGEREGRVVGLPAVVLVGNGGRRRMDKQLLMVRRSVEEVEANMRRKMEREKEKRTESASHASSNSNSSFSSNRPYRRKRRTRPPTQPTTLDSPPPATTPQPRTKRPTHPVSSSSPVLGRGQTQRTRARSWW